MQLIGFDQDMCSECRTNKEIATLRQQLAEEHVIVEKQITIVMGLYDKVDQKTRRIEELAAENKRLRERIHDLQFILKEETGGQG